MENFEYIDVTSLKQLPEVLGKKWGESAILAGGTDLLDRLKERIATPKQVVNIKHIKELQGMRNGSGLEIGALVTISEIAANKDIGGKYPVLAEAAASIATPQLRNMGTIGGNLCQRPRCWYFRSKDYHCLKKGGAKCYAAEGLNKYHAIFGGGPCFIVHPSDSAPALIALEASIKKYGPDGEQKILLEDFFQLPYSNLLTENVMKPNEVITKIIIPEPQPDTRSTYLKFREKLSLDFAVSSVAAVVQLRGSQVRKARIVLGGVAPIPWRVQDAEAALEGKSFTDANIQKAADAAVAGADPMEYNEYKIHLTRNLVRRALTGLKSA